MKHERGNWQVLRNCCRSGNCVVCHNVTPLGTPTRVVQANGYSQAYAEFVADMWSDYGAVAGPMEPDAVPKPKPLPPPTLLQMVLDESEVLNPDGSARPLSEDLLAKIRATLN